MGKSLYWSNLVGHFDEDVVLDVLFGLDKLADLGRERKETGKLNTEKLQSLKDWARVVITAPDYPEIKQKANKTLKKNLDKVEEFYQLAWPRRPARINARKEKAIDKNKGRKRGRKPKTSISSIARMLSLGETKKTISRESGLKDEELDKAISSAKKRIKRNAEKRDKPK